jgi:hypothetical protein
VVSGVQRPGGIEECGAEVKDDVADKDRVDREIDGAVSRTLLVNEADD